MSGSTNVPLRHWLADRVDDFKLQLEADEDPSVCFEVLGCIYEIRLIHAPGVFTREELPIELDESELRDG